MYVIGNVVRCKFFILQVPFYSTVECPSIFFCSNKTNEWPEDEALNNTSIQESGSGTGGYLGQEPIVTYKQGKSFLPGSPAHTPSTYQVQTDPISGAVQGTDDGTSSYQTSGKSRTQLPPSLPCVREC